jgi:uncharacterized protein YpmS
VGLDQDLAEKLGRAEKAFAELEKKSMQNEAELKKKVEGLSSKNEVIDKQLTELKANYKQERQDLELKFSIEMKDYRADAEAKIKRLEQDIASAMTKVLPDEAHFGVVALRVKKIDSCLFCFCRTTK